MFRTIIQAFKKPTASLRFQNSKSYWERRYALGGSSGSGSYGEFAEFKAEVLNHFLLSHCINSVIEFGCGDGNQLSMVNYPQYIGIDVSQTALNLCQARFAGDPTKTFLLSDHYSGQTAECAVSLDVLYHLVEDQAFADYMRNLFSSASRFVIIYTSNVLPHELEARNSLMREHVRHRHVTGYVAENYSQWKLAEHIPNRYPYNPKTGDGSFAEFFVYALR
jgi:SAM-dependent methyltransferase